MNIALPILFTALIIGLFARRITRRHWLLMGIVITIVIIRYYIRGN